MTILICGSEGEWAGYTNTLNALGADDKRRGSVLLTSGETMSQTFAATKDCWVHVRFAGEDSAHSLPPSGPQVFVQVLGAGYPLAGLKSDSFVGNHDSWAMTPVLGSVFSATFDDFYEEQFRIKEDEFQDWDIHVAITTAGSTDDLLTVRFYRNGQLRATMVSQAPGIPNLVAWPDVTQIQLSARDTDTDNGRDHAYFQDVLVTDGIPTVGASLRSLFPGAAGNYNGFTNDHDAIDEEGYDPTDLISTSAVGVRESWVFGMPFHNMDELPIYAVVLTTVANIDGVSPVTDFQPFLRISSTDYAGANLGATTFVASYFTTFTQNPATTNAWQASELLSLEAGVLTV